MASHTKGIHAFLSKLTEKFPCSRRGAGCLGHLGESETDLPSGYSTGLSVKARGINTNARRAWKGVIHSDSKLAKKVSGRK